MRGTILFVSFQIPIPVAIEMLQRLERGKFREDVKLGIALSRSMIEEADRLVGLVQAGTPLSKYDRAMLGVVN